ncbi:serum response factor isoform X1 [Ambystoma mexicanum]|uniref:serum response factor isoform X1 n=1 Tax=Ambystoma mexicanum TaxID=8296 RepID=UPI0037E8AE6B
MLPSQGAGNGPSPLSRGLNLGRRTGGAARGALRPGVLSGPPGRRYELEPASASGLYSGSEMDSDSADEEPERRTGALKRGISDLELPEGGGAGGPQGQCYPGPPGGGVTGAKPGKKTRGRVKIKMEFIDNKLRRYTTFSKRKTGIMKKAYELSTLTGTQVLLLVASETGHVYTFATRKLQPMITSETGKALIQTCLNSPDSPPRSDPTTDQRMSATGFEETDLTYQVSESDSSGETKIFIGEASLESSSIAQDRAVEVGRWWSGMCSNAFNGDSLKPAFTVTNLPGTSTIQTTPATSTSMQISSGHSFPITNYLAPISSSGNSNSITSANGTILKTSGSAMTSGGLMQLPPGFTLMSGGPMGQPVPLQAIQVHSTQQTSPSSDSSSDFIQTSSSGTVTIPATIMTSSVPTTVGGHMMYPSPHAVMYAQTSGLTDGGLAVLNAFSQVPSAMQVSHGQVQEQGGVQQVFLTAPSGTVQIPVSAVQLHQMAVIGQQSSSGSSLTELQVVNLDTTHSCKSD